MKNMKRFLAVLSICVFGGMQAQAIPTLQLYIEGATYDTSTETWMANFTSGDTLRLWAIGNVGQVGTISNVRLAVAYDTGSTPTIAITPTTTSLVADPSIPGPVGSTRTGSGTQPTLSDGSFLPPHDIYGPGTDWVDYLLGDFTLTDSPIGDFNGALPFPSLFPSTGQVSVYDITVSGVDDIHFDLYDNIVSGNHVKVKFAPFSHDAGGNGVPDGGMTVALLGMGVCSLLAVSRKLKHS